MYVNFIRLFSLNTLFDFQFRKAICSQKQIDQAQRLGVFQVYQPYRATSTRQQNPQA